MIAFSEFTAFVEGLFPGIQQVVGRYYNQGAAVETKSDGSPVTDADRRIEALIVAAIAHRFPGHSILGEESATHNGGQRYSWCIDPIDGTKSFIGGVPLFTTLIAFCDNGEPLYGAIFNPITGDRALGDNRTCLFNGAPSHVRQCSGIASATVLSTCIKNVEKYQKGANFMRLIADCAVFRTWGDGYGYLMLAAGRADVMVDPVTSPWDSLAVIPVVRGAGGVITDYQGGPAAGGRSIIAAVDAQLHAEVVRLLNG